MTVANGAMGAALLLRRLRTLLIACSILGLFGSYLGCLWTRISDDADGQADGITIFFLTIPIAVVWVVIADAWFARRILEQMDVLKDPMLIHTRKRIMITTGLVVYMGINYQLIGYIILIPFIRNYSNYIMYVLFRHRNDVVY
jgi:hypothetical protein